MATTRLTREKSVGRVRARVPAENVGFIRRGTSTGVQVRPGYELIF